MPPAAPRPAAETHPAGLVRCDPHIAASLSEAGRAEYCRVLGDLLFILRWWDVNPVAAYEFDDFLMEYKAGTDFPEFREKPSKAIFEKTVAALEKVVPWIKGELPITRAAISAWRVSYHTQHTVQHRDSVLL